MKNTKRTRLVYVIILLLFSYAAAEIFSEILTPQPTEKTGIMNELGEPIRGGCNKNNITIIHNSDIPVWVSVRLSNETQFTGVVSIANNPKGEFKQITQSSDTSLGLYQANNELRYSILACGYSKQNSAHIELDFKIESSKYHGYFGISWGAIFIGIFGISLTAYRFIMGKEEGNKDRK